MFHRYPALQVKAYRDIVFGVLVSGIGTEMTKVAVAWQLFQLTHSEFLLGMLGLVGFAPILFGTQFAGVLTDRLPRKMIMAISNGVLALLMLMLGVSVLLDSVNATVLLSFAFCIALFSSFVNVSQTAIFPSLIPKELLSNAITINSTTLSLRRIIGPLIGGVLIALVPVHTIYFLDAISFLVLAVIAMRTPHVPFPVQAVTESLGRSYVKGLQFVLTQRLVLATSIMDFFVMFFASAQTLLPAVVENVYHGNSFQLGLLYSALSIGSLCSGLYLSGRKHIPHMRMVLIWAVTITGIAVVAYGLSQLFVVGLISLFIFGAADETSAIIRNNIRQILTPEHMRARMTGILSLFYIGGPRLGDFEAGLTAAWWGIQPSLVINGVLTLITAGISQVYFHRIRHDFTQVEKVR